MKFMEPINLPELYPEKQKVLKIILKHLDQDSIGYIDVPTCRFII